jgi:hypothetical protein
LKRINSSNAYWSVPRTILTLSTFQTNEYQNIKFCMLFCMGVKHSLLLCGTNINYSVRGSKKDEISEQFRILHTEELNDLYLSPTTDRKLRWVGHITRTWIKIWRPGTPGWGLEHRASNPVSIKI